MHTCTLTPSHVQSVLSAGWTHSPGREMRQSHSPEGTQHTLTLQGTRLECVLNDGDGHWDTPDPWSGTCRLCMCSLFGSSAQQQTYMPAGSGENYKISGAGSWVLKSGRLNQSQ